MTALPGSMVLVCERHALRRLQRSGEPAPKCDACERDRPNLRTRSTAGGAPLFPTKRHRGTDAKFEELTAQMQRDSWDE
jgi:hypothetical protein